MADSISKERVERAARIYTSNNDAATAMGIAPGSFGRLCRRYAIETPQARRLRQRHENEANSRRPSQKASSPTESHPWVQKRAV